MAHAGGLGRLGLWEFSESGAAERPQGGEDSDALEARANATEALWRASVNDARRLGLERSLSWQFSNSQAGA